MLGVGRTGGPIVRLVSGFLLVVGVGIAGLWIALLSVGQVPEVAEGRVDIWFHIAAELLTAALLIAAGVALLRRSARAGLLAAVALGALVYTATNSPGYYAQSGDAAMVGMFALVLLGAGAALLALWRTGPSPMPTDAAWDESPPRPASRVGAP
jgi:hypothetical protein